MCIHELILKAMKEKSTLIENLKLQRKKIMNFLFVNNTSFRSTSSLKGLLRYKK